MIAYSVLLIKGKVTRAPHARSVWILYHFLRTPFPSRSSKNARGCLLSPWESHLTPTWSWDMPWYPVSILVLDASRCCCWQLAPTVVQAVRCCRWPSSLRRPAWHLDGGRLPKRLHSLNPRTNREWSYQLSQSVAFSVQSFPSEATILQVPGLVLWQHFTQTSAGVSPAQTAKPLPSLSQGVPPEASPVSFSTIKIEQLFPFLSQTDLSMPSAKATI